MLLFLVYLLSFRFAWSTCKTCSCCGCQYTFCYNCYNAESTKESERDREKVYPELGFSIKQKSWTHTLNGNTLELNLKRHKKWWTRNGTGYTMVNQHTQEKENRLCVYKYKYSKKKLKRRRKKISPFKTNAYCVIMRMTALCECLCNIG